MSIEIRPVGVTCNLRCQYCYECDMRQRTPAVRYNREKVLAAARKVKGAFSLFGGECLLLPLIDLQELLHIAHERFKQSGIQTNGSLITDKHIELFKRYRTNVGFSIDGPDELNDIRWAGTLEATREHTRRSLTALYKLVALANSQPDLEYLRPSVITTVHAGNLAHDRFPKFLAWLHELDQRGVRYLNLHLMEMDGDADQWSLPEFEIADRLIDIWRTPFTHLQIAPFKELVGLVTGDDEHAVCCWKACDPWNTNAVHGIEQDGSPSHCSRTNKDGINWLPAEGGGELSDHSTFIGHPGTHNYERQLALYMTPQEDGGCRDCRYWITCMGQCPGSGVDRDWRRRTTHCRIFKMLFEEAEQVVAAQGKTPITRSPAREAIEHQLFRTWAAGHTATLGSVQQELKRCSAQHNHGDNTFHGDHTDRK